MKLTNSMETAVRFHLTRLRATASSGDGTCWCTLCRADMMALALTRLPPRYATRRPSDIAADQQLTAAVRDGVALSRDQVSRFPKHAQGSAAAADDPVWVVNFPLEEAFRAVDAVLRRHEGACDCWNCRCDMVAFALNRYPGCYGVEHEGQTHLFEEDRVQMRGEIGSFLDLAARVVMTVPRHQYSTATA
jgi:hypothetical protein